jgi:mycothiol synthase
MYWFRPKMTDFPYSIRGYQQADFDALVRLYQQAESCEPAGRPSTTEAIQEKLVRPGYEISLNLRVAVADGELIGFLDMVPELGISRVIVDCWLKPEHRRKGLGTRLLRVAIDRARELGARFVHVSTRENDEVARTALLHLGFEYIRRFLELRVNMSMVDWRAAEEAAAHYPVFRPGQEELLTRVQNRSFAEHWGYNPNTVEMARYRLTLGRRSPEDVFLAYDGDKVIGFCWTETTEPGKGRIYMIGTDPDYRGRGIGRGLLLAGLLHLKNKVARNVWLTVDSTNKPACSLYESIGFEMETAYSWYQKTVD